MVVPNPKIISIGAEYDGTLAILLFDPIGIALGLSLPVTSVLSRFLGLDDTDGIAVFVEQHVIGGPFSRRSWLMQDFLFLLDLFGVCPVHPHIPACFGEHRVDEQLPRGLFIKRQDVRCCSAYSECLSPKLLQL